MRLHTTPFLTISLIAVLIAANDQHRARAEELPLVIANVTLIDGTGAPPRTYCTIVIDKGKIVEANDTCKVKLPARMYFVDAKGKYLIPGLWDMHVHLPDDKRTLDLFLAHGVTGVRNMYSIPIVHRVKPELRRDEPGRTRVVATNEALDGPYSLMTGFAGAGIKKVPTGEMVRDKVQACLSCTIVCLRCVPPLPRAAFDAAADDWARQAVNELKVKNDFIKTFSLLPRPLYFAAAAEAKRIGVPFVGHVPFEITAEEASNAGQRCIDHLEGIPVCCCRDGAHHARELADLPNGRLGPPGDGNFIWRCQLKAHEDCDHDKHRTLFATFVKNNTYHAPTLIESWAKSQLGDAKFRNDPRLDLLPDLVRGRWRVDVTKDGIEIRGVGLKYTWADLAERKKLIECEMKLVGAMHKAGVPLLAGTDSPNPYCFPGSGVHDELELFVKCGLSPLEALQTATRNPARFLGRDKVLGTIEKGKFADLVLLDANPVDDIRNVRKVAAVIAGGKYLTRDELQTNIKR